MVSHRFLVFLCLLAPVCAFRRRPQASNLTVDYRGNRIKEVQAETLWAVRVLRAAGMHNDVLKDVWPGHWDNDQRTNMDLLWAWIDAMQENDALGALPFRLDPPITYADIRNKDPQSLVRAIFIGHHFKHGKDRRGKKVYGMDYYINHRLKRPDDYFCIPPDGEVQSMKVRHRSTRADPLFEERGRVGSGDVDDSHPVKKKMLSRQESFENPHAGIATLETMPDEALNFFGEELRHGGKKNVRTGSRSNTSGVFERLGAPFIAGPSGSIEYMILAMEDDCLGTCEDGLVPFEQHKVREALISVMTAALIAGGQHSLGECLAVAQAMGYFLEVPSMLEDYHLAAEEFESYSAKVLGVAPQGSNPLSQLRPLRLKPMNTSSAKSDVDMNASSDESDLEQGAMEQGSKRPRLG